VNGSSHQSSWDLLQSSRSPAALAYLAPSTVLTAFYICRRLSARMRGQYGGYHMSGLGPGETSLESLGQGDYSQSVLSSELSSTAIENDNPFADSSGSPLQSQVQHAFQEFSGSPLRHTGNSNQNTAFSDEPKGMSMPSGSWKLPRCLSRSSSQVAAESSPLRWCVSCHSRNNTLLTEHDLAVLCPLRALAVP
jgi:hypothetical protein